MSRSVGWFLAEIVCALFEHERLSLNVKHVKYRAQGLTALVEAWFPVTL